MAIVKCPNCGRMVDDFFGRCIRCKTSLFSIKTASTPQNGVAIYCSVAFIDEFNNLDDKTYFYIADDDSFLVGDTVVVPVGSSEKEKLGVIKDITLVTSFTSPPYPYNKTKRIKRKYTK